MLVAERQIAPRVCAWCRQPIEDTARADARFHSQRCRQSAHRARQLRVAEDLADRSLRLAYADPPYPGLAKKYYGREDSFAGEVDHRALVESLKASFDGWALSTSAAALHEVLPLCPPGTRVCAWCKPIGASTRTAGPHNLWEPLLVVPGRRRRPGVPDWLRAQPARGGGSDLMGRKPLAFCAWMFRLLGAAPGDELVDLFPGSGAVSRAWGEWSLAPGGDA